MTDLKHTERSLIELQGDRDATTLRFHTSFQPPTSMIRQRISVGVENLNNTINHIDLTDVYRTLHPTTAEYTYFFFTCTHTRHLPTLTIVSHTTRLNTFKRIQVVSNMLFGNNGIKLEISNRRISRKSPYNWKLNNTLVK